MNTCRHLVAVLVAVLLVSCSRADAPQVDPWPLTDQEAAPGYKVETEHYSIVSTADRALTAQTGQAVESLFDAYSEVAGSSLDASPPARKMRLRLYADRSEFKANNRSRRWAEGYYHKGVCYAYADATSPSPYHWMLHEAVHQINREITGFATKDRWLNEGLATYLGSSRLIEGRLVPGQPDPNAYPLWWLSKWELSGNWEEDVDADRVIPLRNMITGQGSPSLDDAFNAHYLSYWSVTHFLLHYEHGKYAKGYRAMLRTGGSLADFERHIGPVDLIQSQWYGYLQAQVTKHGGRVG